MRGKKGERGERREESWEGGREGVRKGKMTKGEGGRERVRKGKMRKGEGGRERERDTSEEGEEENLPYRSLEIDVDRDERGRLDLRYKRCCTECLSYPSNTYWQKSHCHQQELNY